MHPEFVAATLDRLASQDAIFIPDTGMSAVWACRYLNMTAGRRMIGSFNHGSMANAMPQAIGAQLAYPGRQVVAMCGDGGLTMLLGDLSTIATYELPIKLIVFDNGLLDMVHWEMLSEGFEPYETDLHNPDFAKLADAYGILGIGVDRHDDVPQALTRAFEHNGPALVSIKTAGLAAGMPQYPTWEQAKGIRQGDREARLARPRRPGRRPRQTEHPQRRAAPRHTRTARPPRHETPRERVIRGLQSRTAVLSAPRRRVPPTAPRAFDRARPRPTRQRGFRSSRTACSAGRR